VPLFQGPERSAFCQAEGILEVAPRSGHIRIQEPILSFGAIPFSGPQKVRAGWRPSAPSIKPDLTFKKFGLVAALEVAFPQTVGR
jgi:hypothetical protein